MEIVFDNGSKKIFTETILSQPNHINTNIVIMHDMGDHATYLIRGAMDPIPKIWRTSKVSMLSRKDGKDMKLDAEFLYRTMSYRGDKYSPLRTLIKMKNSDETLEDKRVVFYNPDGSIEEEFIETSLLSSAVVNNNGSVRYKKNAEGKFVDANGNMYEGAIANESILKSVHALVSKAVNLDQYITSANFDSKTQGTR